VRACASRTFVEILSCPCETLCEHYIHTYVCVCVCVCACVCSMHACMYHTYLHMLNRPTCMCYIYTCVQYEYIYMYVWLAHPCLVFTATLRAAAAGWPVNGDLRLARRRRPGAPSSHFFLFFGRVAAVPGGCGGRFRPCVCARVVADSVCARARMNKQDGEGGGERRGRGGEG
jgi:hypothetical protein